MGFRSNIGRRDNYVVATLGDKQEDTFGNVSEVNVIETGFWAYIEDDRSTRVVDDGHRRDKKIKTLKCDTRDVESLTIQHKFTINDRDNVFVATDIFETEFKFETCIILQSI